MDSIMTRNLTDVGSIPAVGAICPTFITYTTTSRADCDDLVKRPPREQHNRPNRECWAGAPFIIIHINQNSSRAQKKRAPTLAILRVNCNEMPW